MHLALSSTRGRQPSMGKRQHTNFPKKYMKLRKFLSWGWGGGAAGFKSLSAMERKLRIKPF